MKKIFFLLLIFSTFSCTQKSEITEKNYFDLTDLINQQIAQLSQKKPLLTKNLSVNDQQETLQTKDIDWKKELELFAQADINKQAFQQSYIEQKTDSTLVYELKEGENLAVKSLKISFDENKKAEKIEAELSTKNYLYESEKKVLMNLEKGNLKHYEINTWQELFVGKRKFFKVLGDL